MHEYRSHTCGQLRTGEVGQTVRLSGWIHRKRDHGGILFVDLRDTFGVTQLVILPTNPSAAVAADLRRESVITITGQVVRRSESTINPAMPTGEIEIRVDQLVVQGPADQVPFMVAEEQDIPETLRLTYRFVDLRRQAMHEKMKFRSRVIYSLRRRMIEEGFTEFQTPILTSSSPEGARDYLVPSRVYPGKFYALPQAPQQFKQLLMVAGFDKYFQIAPCFRDEDARADRSPGEFYQLDVEMSFVNQDDIFSVFERVLGGLFREFSDWAVSDAPFVRIPYREAMLKYGSDKPDLRFGLEIQDVSDKFAAAEFKIFRKIVEQGGKVRMLAVDGVGDRPRSFFDSFDPFIKEFGGKGLAWILFTSDGVQGSVASAFGAALVEELRQSTGAKPGTALFFIADKEQAASTLAGRLRLKIADELDLREKNAFRFCWIVDFPMYEFDETTKQVIFSHNPFSMPQGGMDALENKPPLEILAHQYDLVCNGVELSSGAIRNHRPDVMYKAFALAGYPPEEVDRRFGAMINAFKLGAPPHGGLAPGVDRMIMLLAQETNIREVIAFPMNQVAQDLMMNAPSEVTQKQLDELHIRINMPVKVEKA